MAELLLALIVAVIWARIALREYQRLTLQQWLYQAENTILESMNTPGKKWFSMRLSDDL